MRALVIGCGYLGRRVAALWQAEGHLVSALTRSLERAQELDGLGLRTVVGDVTRPDSLHELPTSDLVLYAVAPDRRDATAKRETVLSGIENILKAVAGRCGRLVFISTTSVYGQETGEWVDENSARQPPGEDGRIAVAAEQLVRDASSSGSACSAGNVDTVILRFSGIYGPGRMARRVEMLRHREPIRVNPEGFLNLIHVDDGARIAVRAATQAEAGSTYLVTDDRPIRRRAYYELLAECSQSPTPVFEIDDAESRRFNKRCSNARVRTAFGDAFQFPTIETGVPHALHQ